VGTAILCFAHAASTIAHSADLEAD